MDWKHEHHEKRDTRQDLELELRGIFLHQVKFVMMYPMRCWTQWVQKAMALKMVYFEKLFPFR